MSFARAMPPLVALVLLGCSKSQPDERQPSAPWRAAPSASAPTLAARYRVEDRCRASVELRAREASPRGSFRVCRGELDVNLLDLERTRGTLAIDLASIEMTADTADGGRSDEATQRAQSWMDVGASRPEAERERLRWATFTLSSIENASSSAAHTGKRESKPNETPAVESDAGVARGERRVVKLTAKGTLLLHGVRVELDAPLLVAFDYASKAGADVAPESIQVDTRRALRVTLATHDIKPRDSAGVFQAQDMKLFGRQVGREARVDVSLTLKPAAP